ncbi:hypothetical protein REPUB_Repub14bG0083200 [Reevesia pubescens]
MVSVSSSSTSEFQDMINDSDDDFRYLIVRPENGGIWDLMKYSLLGNIKSGVKFLESSDQVLVGGVAADRRWVILVSIIARKIIHLFSKPMELTGYVVDFFLNLISQNGSLFGLFYNFLHDERMDLYKGKKVVEELHNSASGEGIRKLELDDRATMDLCMMASKLAYENAEVARNVVVHHWKASYSITPL